MKTKIEKDKVGIIASSTRKLVSGYTSTSMPEMRMLLFLLAVVIVFGTLGYSVIEGWSFFDSLYMTVITISAVGYSETYPLSLGGRIFTIVLIMCGIGLVTFFLTTLTQYVFEKQYIASIRGRRNLDKIQKLTSHTILCGFGRLARITAEELRRHGVSLVIVDGDPSKIKMAREQGYLALEGDATADETLLQAGIKKASRLVSLLPKGSDNLYVVLTSRELSPSLFIMSRAEDEAFEKRLRRAGATRLISPYRVGGQRIADGLVRPYVTSFLDFAASNSTANLNIEEVKIPDSSILVGKTLAKANLRQHCNVIVAAIIPRSGEMQFNPSGVTTIKGNSTFIVLGEREELNKFQDLLTTNA